MVYEVNRSSPNSISSRIRTIYDKGHHGGNKAKNESLTPEQRAEARKCLLCGMPDSNNHWLHECSFGAIRKLRLEIMGDINRILLSYREKSTLHRQLGTAFKQILTTTSSPARIWTGNWSMQQNEEFEHMINPELLTLFTPNTLTNIILPIERILAEGALNLWQTKVVQERRLPHHEPSKFPSHGPSASLNTNKQKRQDKSSNKVVKFSSLSRASRLKKSRQIYPSVGSSLHTTIAFPSLSTLQKRQVKRACMPENFSTSTLQCNDINVYGSYLCSLCWNEDGSSYNGGHAHYSILKAFIHTLTLSTNITAYIIPDNERHSFLAG